MFRQKLLSVILDGMKKSMKAMRNNYCVIMEGGANCMMKGIVITEAGTVYTMKQTPRDSELCSCVMATSEIIEKSREVPVSL